MWRQDFGDWEERRHRRAPVGRDTRPPPTVETLSTNSIPVVTGRFIPNGFQDEAPLVVAPAATSAPRDDVADLPWATKVTNTTPTWVALMGVDEDTILDVRQFLDLHIGRTVAHCFPDAYQGRSVSDRSGGRQSAARWQGSSCFVRFETSLGASQAVRAASFRMTVEKGAAGTEALHACPRSLVARLQASGTVPTPSSQLCIEFTAAWAVGAEGLLEHRQSPLLAASSGVGADALRRSPSPAAEPRSDASSESGAHPVVSRTGGVWQPRASPSNGENSAMTSEPLRRRQGLQTSSLALFFRSTGCGNVWVWLFKVVVTLVWTAINLWSYLLRGSSTVVTTPAEASSGLSTVRGRKGDVVRGLLSRVGSGELAPVTAVGELYHNCFPFAPDALEVDLLVWSWFSERCLFPQRSLRALQQRLAWGAAKSPSGASPSQHNSSAALPALLVWHPSSWFTQYAIISSVVCVIALLLQFNNVYD